MNSQKKLKKVKSLAKKDDLPEPIGLASTGTKSPVTATAYEELTKLVDDLKSGDMKSADVKCDMPLKLPEETEVNNMEGEDPSTGYVSEAEPGWREADDEFKFEKSSEKLIAEHDDCDKYHLYHYDQITASEKNGSQQEQSSASPAVQLDRSNVTYRSPHQSNINMVQSEITDEDHIEHMISFENGLQSELSIDGSCTTIPTIGLHIAHLDSDEMNDDDLSMLLADCYRLKEFEDEKVETETESKRRSISPVPAPKKTELGIVTNSGGGGVDSDLSNKSKNQSDVEAEVEVVVEVEVEGSGSGSGRMMWSGNGAKGEEESKGATEEVLYWRQEVIQQHMDSYAKGTLNPAMTSQSRSYCITAGFDETALKGNPYSGPGSNTTPSKSRKYLNFFSIEQKFFNENGKEIVQILKIWISPFWSVFQFAARFCFVTVPSFGFNLVLEFNYLLFKIAKRVASFWVALALYCLFSLPYQIFCYCCTATITIVLSTITKTLNHTPSGAKIVKRIEKEMKLYKSGKGV